MQVMEESTDQRFREMDGRFDRLEASVVDFRTEVRDSIAELREEIKRSNAELRKEIKDSNVELRQEIKGSSAELRKEIKESYVELSGRMERLQNTLLQVGGGLIGTMILFLAAALF
jgi:uncharacterized protein YdhG (YjbR/CyaY superfamily)